MTDSERVKSILQEWAENYCCMDIDKVMAELQEIFRREAAKDIHKEVTAHGWMDADEMELRP